MKRLRLIAICLGVLSIVLFAATIYLFLDRNEYRESFESEQQANTALFDNAGRMCAVISMSEAAKELQSEVTVDAASYPSGFAKAIEQSEIYPSIDSCRYLGTKNNTRYLNLVGQRYDNVDQAKSDFALQRQIIQDAESRDAQAYQADEVFYYGGAMFMRDGEVIFSLSVNKPEITGSQLEAYTKELFDSLYLNALSLL